MDFIVENKSNEVKDNNVTSNNVTNNNVTSNKVANNKPKNKMCSFRTTDTLQKKIKIMALYKQKTMNELITEMIEQKVNEYQKENQQLFDKFDF